MAYPVKSLGKVLDQIESVMIGIRGRCVALRDRSLIANIPSSTIFELYVRLKADKAILDSLSGTPGLPAYAQTAYNNAGLNIATEFTAVTTALNNTTSWIENNFPKDGNGYLLASTLTANGPVDRQFDTASLATFRTVLDALIATIGT